MAPKVYPIAVSVWTPPQAQGSADYGCREWEGEITALNILGAIAGALAAAEIDEAAGEAVHTIHIHVGRARDAK